MYGQYTTECKIIIIACSLATIVVFCIYAVIEDRIANEKVIKSQKKRKVNNFEDFRKKYATKFEIRDFRKNFNF